MKVAFIPPIQLLDNVSSDLHLMLPHLMSDGVYEMHFNKLARDNAYIILDNGAAEGTPAKAQFYDLIFGRAGIREFALPDALHDGNKTIAQAETFLRNNFTRLEKMGNKAPSIGLVAQGINPEEALETVERGMKSRWGSHIDVIYIPRLLVTPDDGGIWNRIKLASLIYHRWPRLDIHLFGASSYHPLEALLASQFKYIRSIDTSLPWRYAENNKLLRDALIMHTPEETARSSDYFTRYWSPGMRRTARDNECVYRGWTKASAS